MKGRLAVILAGLAVLAGCGGSSKPVSTGALAGNWQFTLKKTTNPRTTTLLSGFLQQTGKAVTGAVELTPPLSSPPPCGGSFQVAGSGDGQNVTLTVNEGGATVSLTGISSASAMGGTYSLVASGCGKDESGTWTATLVKPLTGTFQGILHSTDSSGILPLLRGGDFAVTGQLLQGDNVGATHATLTGTIQALSLPTGPTYPCFTDATLSGTITGTAVLLNIIGSNGLVLGTIGNAATGTTSVNAKPDGSGLAGLNGYSINKSSGCSSQEKGNVCVDLGSSTSCKQPIAFSQDIVAFNPILVATSSSSQTVTVTNQSSADIDLTSLEAGVQGVNSGDYTADFSACPATLPTGASCPIPITFTPSAGCPTFNPGFSEPLLCPLPRTAALSAVTTDPDSPHTLQLTGVGLDPVAPDVNDLNFGVIPAKTISPPLTITFTNQGPATVTITSVAVGGNDSSQVNPFTPCGTAGSIFPTCDFVTKSQAGAVNNCTPPSTLQDACTGQPIQPNGSCKVDFVFCPLIIGTAKEDIQIITDEHDLNGPTADSTRVPVQLDGRAN